MPDLTRRRALHAVASGVAALAGCADADDRPTIDRRRNDQAIEYDVRAVRNADGAVLFTQRDALPTATDDDRSRHLRSARSVVVSEAGIEDLTFGDVPEAEALRTFAAETDFESSSLYLLAMPVRSCYEIRLRSATVERDELENDDLHPHADFCRTYRPADVECETEAFHTAGFAIRLAVAAEQSTGSGRGMASSCRPSPRGEYFNATVTPAGGAGE